MSPARVVIVEDDRMLAALNATLVDDHPGFEVVAVAHTASAGLREIEHHRPDLLLLDVYLPDLNGLELLRRLRAMRTDVEVIAVTAARDLETVRRARVLGVRHYLVKPFTKADLHRRLNEVQRALSMTAGDADLDQRAVDLMLGGGSDDAVAAPRNLSASSLQRVAELLDGAEGDMSSAEIADALGMSRVSARRYLDHLATIGRAEVAPRYGAVGRPENRYRAIRR
ncbi:response regulator [Microbacterium azadirachtae]|uniref:Transcriptional regulatory protein n=1 Tax=Microbacterium azadirachtae TaxID=582680 RepID=A0A0F0LRR3_9MICO|nr:response regulator [Microbacterium azadirachtae]KJL34186.1 Transcriptional regulatory protein CitT [Microbacterium azadirachtae]